MHRPNMVRIVVLLFSLASVVVCQRVSNRCAHEIDINSPFYFPGEEDLCTEELCQMYPDLGCEQTTQADIDSAIRYHTSHNITEEVAYMQRYFDTYLPSPTQKDYTCHGICDKGPELMTRTFTDLDYYDYDIGAPVKARWLCFVVGPKIYRRNCRGRCKSLFGAANMYCVNDVFVTLDVWVYCPNIQPGCRRISMKVPLSCACKEITCKAGAGPKLPMRPPRLPQWVDTSMGPIDFVPNDPNLLQIQPAVPQNLGPAIPKIPHVPVPPRNTGPLNLGPHPFNLGPVPLGPVGPHPLPNH